MKSRLSIQERLKDLRTERKLKLEELSNLTGISKSALGSYEADDYKEINHGNLVILADFYGVSLDYLLCRTENREQVNTPLMELHLNDETVELLKSGKINNRLLCEIKGILFSNTGSVYGFMSSAPPQRAEPYSVPRRYFFAFLPLV